MEAQSIISRQDAKTIGQQWFFNGVACKHGHISRRSVHNSGCLECQRLRFSSDAHKAKQSAAKKERYARDRFLILEKQKEYLSRSDVRLKKQEYERKRAQDPARKEYMRSIQRKLRQTEHRKNYVKDYWGRRNKEPERMALIACRTILRHSLTSAKIGKSWERTSDALGYTPDQLRAHLESWFIDGMSWSNRGEWEIDHVISVAEFIRLGITDPAKINALSNLRPVWKEHNRAKGDGFALVMPA